MGKGREEEELQNRKKGRPAKTLLAAVNYKQK